MKPTVVIGLLGTELDRGKGRDRWQRWRPTVALCQHEDLLVSRLELLHEVRHTALAAQVTGDIATVSPETRVQTHPITLANPWDLEEVYSALHDFARAYPWRPDRERYLVHITTGTHIAQ